MMKIDGKQVTPILWGEAKGGTCYINEDIANRVIDGEVFSTHNAVVEVSYWEKNENGRAPVYYIPLKLVPLRWMLRLLSKFKIFPRKLWDIFSPYSDNISIITVDNCITDVKVGYIEK